MHIPRNIQSPYTATDFWNKWSSVNPRMALFIKVTPSPLSNNYASPLSVIGFTSNSRDMTLPGHAGVTFKSAVGITPSAIEMKLEEASSLEMQGMYTSGTFERNDIIGGLWDYAEIEIFSASWDNPNLGELVHFRGNLGEFKDYQQFFNVEARGLLGRLSSDAGVVTTRYCRVKNFGDSQCKFTANTVTIDSVVYDISVNGEVYSADSNRRMLYFLGSLWDGGILPLNIPPDGFFNNGQVTCTAGANEGISREVLKSTYAGGKFRLSLKRAFPFAISSGDLFDIKAGCNRTLEDCKKFNNVINFRGEPYIPGIEAMNRVPPSQ